jgi:hypothetical protein
VAPPNGTISNVFRLIPARAEAGIEQWVELEDGRRLRLDPQDPRSGGFAQVLSGLQQQRRPVYIEFDPETSVVTALRIPHVSPVLALRAIAPGLLDVVLALSHARHFLRTDSEDSERLRERLDDAVRTRAPVVVVEDDAQQIIDVQPAPSSDAELGPPFPEKPSRPCRGGGWTISWTASGYGCAGGGHGGGAGASPLALLSRSSTTCKRPAALR